MGTVSEPTDVLPDVDLRESAPHPESEPAPEVVVDLRAATGPALSATDAAPGGAGEDAGPDPGAGPDPVADPGPDVADGQDVLDLDAFPTGARGAVEAVLMVVDEPLADVTLASALRLTVPRVRDLLAELAADYDEAGRGFELRQVAGGWRIYSRADYAPVIERFMLDGQTAKLTQAALETLAIVAYRQPVSRARVGAVRGVNVDAVMRTLVSRGLVEEAGTDPESGALLYRTTSYFLQRLGLGSLDDLPALAPYLPEVDALDEFGMGAAS
jgi:segregation and condensation protein B